MISCLSRGTDDLGLSGRQRHTSEDHQASPAIQLCPGQEDHVRHT